MTSLNESGQAKVLSKWRDPISKINKVYEGKLPYETQVGTAMILENTASHLDKVASMRQFGSLHESTQPSDISYFKNYSINLLSAVMPSLIAHEIVGVQPMQSSIGEVRYLNLVYGSDKGQVKAGDVMMSPLAAGTSDYNYSSSAVADEFVEVSGTSLTTNLTWLPVLPGTVKFTDGIDTITDDGQGKLVGSKVTTGTVDYSTGEVKATLSESVDALELSYEYNNMDTPVQAPEVNLEIKSSPIIAKSRKLKIAYSFDASYSMSTDYGMQINNELMTYTAAQLKHEIDGEILNDLQKMAGAAKVTWDATPREAISLRDHNESLANKLVEASNAIFQATRFAKGSFYVVGTEVANVVETLDGFESSGAINPQGPHFLGYLRGKSVYINPFYDPTSFVVGFKGDSMFDSGYIYAPFMPIMATNLLVDADFEARRGFATSYGKKLINRNMYTAGQLVRS